MYVKPSGFFKEKFEHDMSGLELVSAGPDYKRVIISRVAAGSPAALEGLESGDEIISINFKPVSEFSVNEIDNLFKSGNERSYLLSILPKNSDKTKKILFTLKRRI
jgi:C-terminal processing protease CtpA/Prc